MSTIFKSITIAWALALVCIGVLFLYNREMPVSASQPKQPPDNVAVDNLRLTIDADFAVRTRLRDPDSARFRSVLVGGVGNNRIVCGDVNAKNGFGGYSGYVPFVYREASKTISIGNDPDERTTLVRECLLSTKEGQKKLRDAVLKRERS